MKAIVTVEHNLGSQLAQLKSIILDVLEEGSQVLSVENDDLSEQDILIHALLPIDTTDDEAVNTAELLYREAYFGLCPIGGKLNILPSYTIASAAIPQIADPTGGSCGPCPTKDTDSCNDCAPSG